MTKRVPKHETVNGHRVACYDNEGRTADRYTVVYLDYPEVNGNSYACIGMDDRPFHPQGIGMHGAATPGRHLGRRILLSNLPPDCQKAVRQDLKH